MTNDRTPANIIKGPKFTSLQDEDGEIRILYRRSSKKLEGLQLSFFEPKCASARSLSRKESQEFLKLKEVRVYRGNQGISPIRIFADRDPRSLRKYSQARDDKEF